MNSGNQLELFMYNTFGANTVQVSEGTVQSGITATVGTTVATIGEYAKKLAHQFRKKSCYIGEPLKCYEHVRQYRGKTEQLIRNP